MGDFNQREYNLLYNKNKRTWIRVNVSNEEREKFDAYCISLGVKSSTYVKTLINNDMKRRGLEPLFKIRNTDAE